METCYRELSFEEENKIKNEYKKHPSKTSLFG